MFAKTIDNGQEVVKSLSEDTNGEEANDMLCDSSWTNLITRDAACVHCIYVQLLATCMCTCPL